MTTLDLTPAPGAAPIARMLAAQTVVELRLLLRRGESFLLLAVIPLLLLVAFSQTSVVDVDEGRRIDFLVPGIIALSVMSTAFTGQAISTGFERQYGVLKRLGATALPRSVLLLAKTLAVFAIEMVQIGLVVAVGFALDWHPHGNPLPVLVLLLLGTVAFSGLGLLIAGTLRAEATLAGANLVYVLLLGIGGVVFPLSKFPDGVRRMSEQLPITALSDGLRAVFRDGGTVSAHDWLVLAGWAVAALTAAAATFRWE
ncbi:MAG: type transport system permease protein [Frankiales bacterium]|jgi:ABC-2 type transport system permease protein|nr:type transport system permease protein [Frankiales bacterium]